MKSVRVNKTVVILLSISVFFNILKNNDYVLEIEEWRKFHNYELCNLYFPLCIVRFIKDHQERLYGQESIHEGNRKRI
jgi:hypothetical protein